MGRGLSDLQTMILHLALANREAEGRDTSLCDVLYSEVLTVYWGWKPERPLRNADGKQSGGQLFSVGKVGPRAYNTAHAALTRAVDRLAVRGLVVAVSGTYTLVSGVNLTGKGVQVARQGHHSNTHPPSRIRP